MKKNLIVPILNHEYKVVVCWDTIPKAKKLMKDWGYNKPVEQHDLDGRRGVTFYDKDCAPFILLPAFPKTPEQIGTLAHEAVHAVMDIFIKVDERNYDEVFAHSVGAVVREVLSLKKK